MEWIIRLELPYRWAANPCADYVLTRRVKVNNGPKIAKRSGAIVLGGSGNRNSLRNSCRAEVSCISAGSSCDGLEASKYENVEIYFISLSETHHYGNPAIKDLRQDQK